MTFKELEYGDKFKLADNAEFKGTYTKMKRKVRKGRPVNCYDDVNFLFCIDSTVVEVLP